jgi:large subunit ribosomal protein L29
MKVTRELQELRERSSEALQTELKEARNRLFQDRVRFATRSLDNSNPLRAGKKRVARILTLIREAELKEQAAAGTTNARRKRR